jgi:hypothetical protein
MSFSLQLPGSVYDQPKRLQFVANLQQKLSSLPGVESAALASGLPPLRRINANDTEIEGYQQTPEALPQNIDYWNFVGIDYFKTMKIRTIEGRTFERFDDGDKSLKVVVVNESLAKRFWKGSPIGRRVNASFQDPRCG